MLHPFKMFGGTYILTEWRAFGSAFLFCEFTPLYGLNHENGVPFENVGRSKRENGI